MALKDVIIGYAKGDKGDKGDTGERGATGQTGPQGEPGNIADAAITDTQGLDVAKGAKTTAQKLFDAIADRIVNKLVTNDTLTTKLADYLLKSAMSSTNIDSTTNVPTSALVYSLMQDVNNNLSKKADATSLSSYALKSDLTAYSTKAQLESTFINLTNKRYVKITAAENYSNYGIIFAVTSHGILCVYSENGNFTTLFESAGTSVKISASGLVTTIDCVSTYTHGFILRGGSLKDMPYEISQS